MKKRKPLPVEVSQLLVPNLDYEYFAAAGAHPFRPALRSFDLLNAWWLAEASFLAYVRDPRFVAACLGRAGLRNAVAFEKRATACHVAEADDWILCVFRGTDVTEIDNVLTDINFILGEHEGEGRVHRGFKAALDVVWQPLSNHLRALPSTKIVWFTGHSLGAALATLAARRFDRERSLVTFGSPRVGDAAWSTAHSVPTWRVVNHLDLVAFLPPPLRYRHVGAPTILGEDGSLEDSPRAWDLLKRRALSVLRTAGTRELFSRGGFARLLTRNSVADHAPIGYAVKLWNLFCAT